jgi:hypothetical protein
MIWSELSKQKTSRPLATQRSLPELDRTSALTGRANFFSANSPRSLLGSCLRCCSSLSRWVARKMVSPVLRDHALTLLSSPAAKTKFADGSTQNPCIKESVWVYRSQIKGNLHTRFWECVLTWPASAMTGQGEDVSEELPLDWAEKCASDLDPAPQNRISYNASYKLGLWHRQQKIPHKRRWRLLCHPLPQVTIPIHLSREDWLPHLHAQ